MDNFTNTVMHTVQHYKMLQKGDTVIVACSGGADSVALFHFLLLHQKEYGYNLRVVHVHHGVRKASDDDETFVRMLCARTNVPLDVCKLTPSDTFSEAWGRQERYRFFDALANQYGAKIATAHTLSDNAETVLLNLTRGAVLHGASGIPPVRGVYIRPCIACSRAMVEAYLDEHHETYVTDESNASLEYARNRVRHTVLPTLKQTNANVEESLAHFATEMQEVACYLDAQAQALLADAKERDYYRADVLLQAPHPVRRCALRMLILPCCDPSRRKIEALEQALQTHGVVTLSKTDAISCAQGCVRTIKINSAPPTSWSQPYAEMFKVGQFCSPTGQNFTIRTQSYENFINFQEECKKRLKNVADCDKIDSETCFRTRAVGDVFAPPYRGVTKTIKDLFSEAKLSASARNQLALLANESEILWVENFGFSQKVLPSKTTKKVVILECTEEENESHE